jgi:tripeptide aminopeptidase
MIDRKRVLDEFFELVRIRCSTGDERQVADVLKARLAGLGLTVDEDEVGAKIGGNTGNVFALLKGSKPGAPRIMFSAHMDSVEPCAGIEPRLKDGIITAGGATILGADCKSGIVPILEALRVVRDQGLPHGDIQIVFTVAEEGGVNGSKNMDPARLAADMAFVMDASGAPGKLITRAPGKTRVDVVIHGKKAHAGLAPEDGVNAIVVAGKALAQLTQGRIDPETTANVGVIAGGESTNVVPDRVLIACEARSQDNAKLTALVGQMTRTFTQVAQTNGARAEVTTRRDYDPYALAPDAPQVVLARQAMESLGLTPDPAPTGGGSDANFFNAYGTPTVVLGTGMAKGHTLEEFIREEHLYQTCELVLAIIKTAAAKAA